MMPMKELLDKKDNEIKALKQTIVEQKIKLDDLEQHGRCDTLRIAGIPENPDNDDTDAAVLGVCATIKMDPPLEPQDIVVSHRVGKQVTGKHRQIIVKFALRTIRERVFRAKSDLKSVNQQNEDKPKICINEDLTQFRAGLAREAPSYRASGLVTDTWTIYGKVMIKDTFGRVRIIKTYDDLFRYKQTTGSDVNAESGEQSTTDRR